MHLLFPKRNENREVEPTSQFSCWWRASSSWSLNDRLVQSDTPNEGLLPRLTCHQIKNSIPVIRIETLTHNVTCNQKGVPQHHWEISVKYCHIRNWIVLPDSSMNLLKNTQKNFPFFSRPHFKFLHLLFIIW